MVKKLLRASVNAIPSPVRRWIKHVPVVAWVQRRLVNDYLSGETFVHRINAGPARGLRFRLTLPQDKLFWAGIFEPEFTAALAHAARSSDVCFDIGGHRGYMSGVMALAGAQRVVVFEPLADNVAALRDLADLNPDLPLQVEATAIGRANGEARFKVMADRSMGKLAESSFQVEAAAAAELIVPVRQLDSLVFAGNLPAPNLIKIDVEGAEFDVLQGARRTLETARPRLFIEAHSSALAASCTGFLAERGYRVTQLQSGPLGPEQARHLIAVPQ
jgi:FkbM family methyltransferase